MIGSLKGKSKPREGCSHPHSTRAPVSLQSTEQQPRVFFSELKQKRLQAAEFSQHTRNSIPGREGFSRPSVCYSKVRKCFENYLQAGHGVLSCPIRMGINSSALSVAGTLTQGDHFYPLSPKNMNPLLPKSQSNLSFTHWCASRHGLCTSKRHALKSGPFSDKSFS